MKTKKGNLFGLVAILMWSSLGILSVFTQEVPAFELTAFSFFIASIIGLVLLKKNKVHVKELFKIELKVWIVGVVGLFGYHLFYFLAVKNAPVVEANLINYMWPLLIVLFSSFLPNEKLKWYHIVGVLLGLIGSYFIVSNGYSSGFKMQYLEGYIYALIAAILWASYSVISRTFSHVPTYAVTGFCMLTFVLASVGHVLFEEAVIPNLEQSIGILLIGLGPVGGAFYFWDYGVKNADIKLLGSTSYFIPLLSTLILVLFGYASFTFAISIACIFIILGSFISSAEYLKAIKEYFFK